MPERVSGFCPGPRATVAGHGSGPLAGSSFAAKDVFDVAGHITGAGNPDWAGSHPAATAHAPAVARLLAAGAGLAGKTITDELTFSMVGDNFHYGMPVNPAAPGRIPGGSSSGSASVVAAGLVDFALGTDTAGSVRLPASFCGLYGLRPSHGAIPSQGVVPLAPGFDTVGWFARDAELLEQVGQVLLGNGEGTGAPDRLLICRDALELCEPPARPQIEAMIARIAPHFREVTELRLADREAPGPVLADWVRPFRIQQGFEIWRAHGAWIERLGPRFGPDVAARFKWSSAIDAESAEAAGRRCAAIAQYIGDLFDGRSVMALPSSPGIAPPAGPDQAVYEDMRRQALQMVAISSIAGTPQMSLPLDRLDGCPLGLGLMAGRGQDHMLLALARRIADRP